MDYNTENNFNIVKYILHNITTFKQSKTFILLTVSLFMSISGIFRVFISSMLLNVNINVLMCFAAGLVVYAIYTYDRIGDDRFKGSNKKYVLGIIALASLAGFYIFATNGLLLIALFFCVVGYLYGKEIKICKHTIRLKGSYGIKNIVVGITWAVLVVGSTGSTNLIPVFIIFLFMLSKSFINSTINDFKDIPEDKLNGILTLPVSIGELQTRNLLLGILFLSNLMLYVSMFLGIIQFNYIILGCSLLCGFFGIMSYADSQSRFSKVIRDGESFITVLLVLISGSALTAFCL